MATGDVVHVLIIEHKFGRNITVHESEPGAMAEAGECAKAWWSEVADELGEMPEDPRERAAAYFDAQPEEFMSIDSATVQA